MGSPLERRRRLSSSSGSLRGPRAFYRTKSLVYTGQERTRKRASHSVSATLISIRARWSRRSNRCQGRKRAWRVCSRSMITRSMPCSRPQFSVRRRVGLHVNSTCLPERMCDSAFSLSRCQLYGSISVASSTSVLGPAPRRNGLRKS